jgi:hypothetical protein
MIEGHAKHLSKGIHRLAALLDLIFDESRSFDWLANDIRLA